jgi:hypothetical protein
MTETFRWNRSYLGWPTEMTVNGVLPIGCVVLMLAATGVILSKAAPRRIV